MTLKVDTASNKIYLTGTDININNYSLKEPLSFDQAFDLAVELLAAIQENMREIK